MEAHVAPRTWELLVAAGVGLVVGGTLVALHARRRECHGFLRHLRAHVSIRKFSDRPVPRRLLEELMQIGVCASTSGNMQTYSVIMTTDPTAIEKLKVIHDNSSMGSAKAVLTFCADWSRHVKWCALRDAQPEYDNFMAFITGNNDAMVAAQTFAVAAEASGLGICFLGSTTWATSELCKFFALPRYVHPVTSIMLGWPGETPSLRARLPMNGILHAETYRAMSEEEVLLAYQSREIEGWDRYVKLYGAAWEDKVKKYSIKNLPQAYTTLKYTGRDFRRWSRQMLGTLEQQGFSSHSPRAGDDRPGPHNI